MGNTKGPPTESDPKTDAHHLGIKAEDAPLYFQDGRRRLRSANSQPFNLTAFRSDPEWRPHWTEVLLQNHAGVPLPDPHTVPAVLLRGVPQDVLLESHLGRPIHDAERPFVCPQCGRTFTFKSNLTRHMRFHSDAQPYVCPQCGQGFKISAHLKRHMTAHSGCKLYVCPECGQSYMSLKYHWLSHTGERPLSCPECPMTFEPPGYIPNASLFPIKMPFGTPSRCSQVSELESNGESILKM
uniref:C2H2-type domain-containing protein n=1 Tax=Oncorhynchus mykiss TaxID=8022 RepID=A0A8K9XPU3_ONCMY